MGAEPFDVLVIGAGIHGACVARDAALRGMRVALIDKGDFGSAASHNSLKLVHGGLRYLQQADLKRIRESVRERRFWLRTAPHLVRPLRFVTPLYGWGTRGPMAMWAALRIYDLLALDRNRGVAANRRLPRGRIVSKREVLRLAPGLDQRALTGGAIWYDAQMMDSDRVLLECIQSACAAGAQAANYVAAAEFLTEDGEVCGVRARDLLTGEDTSIRARVTINTTGAWIEQLLRGAKIPSKPRHDGLHRGMNLVVRRLVDHDCAIGFVSGQGRLYFITPWRGYSIVGTRDVPHTGEPDGDLFSDEDIRGFLDEINAAYPAAELKREDVKYCYAGLTPTTGGNRARKTELRDHGQGLISVSGVKYTTARLVAERAVDLACRRLDGDFGPCIAATTPLPGAEGHGTELDDTDELDARCLHAVREEMAVHLSDIVWRRVDRTHVEELTTEQLEQCARLMAAELGWSEAGTAEEVREVQATLARHRGRRACS